MDGERNEWFFGGSCVGCVGICAVLRGLGGSFVGICAALGVANVSNIARVIGLATAIVADDATDSVAALCWRGVVRQSGFFAAAPRPRTGTGTGTGSGSATRAANRRLRSLLPLLFGRFGLSVPWDTIGRIAAGAIGCWRRRSARARALSACSTVATVMADAIDRSPGGAREGGEGFGSTPPRGEIEKHIHKCLTFSGCRLTSGVDTAKTRLDRAQR
jgi:hypothetical protein